MRLLESCSFCPASHLSRPSPLTRLTESRTPLTFRCLLEQQSRVGTSARPPKWHIPTDTFWPHLRSAEPSIPRLIPNMQPSILNWATNFIRRYEIGRAHV